MASSLAWSPDGLKFALVSNLDGNQDITVVNSDGSMPINLTRSPDREDFPAWSPDGRYIMFSREASAAGRNQIWIVRPDGTDARFLSNGFCGHWSPDSRRITFGSSSAIYIATVSDFLQGGGEIQAVKIVDIPGRVDCPVFSPQGDRILFSALQDGRWGIYVANVDGSGVLELAPGLPHASDAVWSPDGGRVAFISHASHTSLPEVYVINADGTGLSLIPNSSGGRGICWSPDGTRLLFESSRETGLSHIYLTGADGAGLVRLTEASGTREYCCPSWQP